MIAPNIWLGLSPETRRTLALMLEIPKSGGVEVAGNRVVSDGYTPSDLAIVDLKYLQNFMQMPEETDFYKMFFELVRRVEAPVDINQIIEEVQKVETKEELEDAPVVKKRGRQPKITIN